MASHEYYRKNVKFLLQERGAHKDLAQAVGIDPAVLTRRLKPSGEPGSQIESLENACKVANALSVPLGDLVDMLPSKFAKAYESRLD